MSDYSGRLESNRLECRESVGLADGMPNRLAPLLFPLVAAFLAVSLFSGCGSVGGEAKADVQSESRDMPSDAGTGSGNEGESKKKNCDGSEKNGDGAKSDTAGDAAGDSTGNPGAASVPDGYESGGEIAGGAATVYVPSVSSDGGEGDGTESPSADDGLGGSIGDAEVVIAN